MNILLKSILGELILDSKYNITKKDKKHYRETEDKDFPRALEGLKDSKYFADFRKKNIEITKAKIKSSFTEDIFIVQCSNALSEISRTINTHAKRLREWVSYVMPELSEEIYDNYLFVETISKQSKGKAVKAMSVDVEKENLQEMNDFAFTILKLYDEKKRLEQYLDIMMQKICPNITAVAGAGVGAKLIALVGSLGKLAKSAASKIQLLGAEVALFRHLKTGAKAPKHGIIHEHKYVSQAKKQDRGKNARKLADKISIAAKIDYFKGEFIGKKLAKELK